MSNKQIWKIINILLILAGNAIYALGLVAFVLPNKLITGGSTGLALTFHHYFDIPISAFVLIFNIIMFAVGGFILGKKFAFTTLISTFFYPLILDVFQNIPALSGLTQDRMLATICGGILIGFGIAIVIRAGASTGGMDIPPLVLNKKFGIAVSVSLYIFDVTILLLQMSYSDIEEIIYGIILVLVYSVVLDKVLLLGSSKTQVQIISNQTEAINEAILNGIDRGTTLLHGETGFLRNEQSIILTIISNRELIKLKQTIKSIDPNAFMVISHVNEVKGKGFSRSKKYQTKVQSN